MQKGGSPSMIVEEKIRKAHRSKRTKLCLAYGEVVCEEQHSIARFFKDNKKGVAFATPFCTVRFW